MNLPKRVVAYFVALASLVVVAIASREVLGWLLIIAIALQVVSMLRGGYFSIGKNTVYYLLPAAYIINLNLRDAPVDNVSLLNAFLGMVVSLVVALYKPIKTKLSKKRPILVANLRKKNNKTPSLRNRVVKFAAKKKRYVADFLVLGAIYAMIYAPFFVTVIFAGMILFMLTHIALKVIRKERITQEEVVERGVARIKKYNPEFAVFLSIIKDSQNIYMMWHDYFVKTGKKFIVVTPQLHHFKALSEGADIPVVFCKNSRVMEQVFSSGIKAVFYPSNSPKNMDATISLNPTHVHIGHGDSDKASSYRLVTGMYDKIFVAGQEAIDRYENHGVIIPRDKFTIVGRPQVEGLEKMNGEVRTVLYAPTWHGDVEGMDYTSLYQGKEIIETLLSKGLRVVFRPHPSSRTSPRLSAAIDSIHSVLRKSCEDNGVDHIYGERAENDMSVFDCINVSDMMISDVSSVVSDYLYSEKPIILIAMKHTKGEFLSESPIARAAYVVDSRLDGLSGILDKLMRGKDIMRKKRKGLKEGYLSKTPDKGVYSDLFVDAVNNVIGEHRPRRAKIERAPQMNKKPTDNMKERI